MSAMSYEPGNLCPLLLPKPARLLVWGRCGAHLAGTFHNVFTVTNQRVIPDVKVFDALVTGVNAVSAFMELLYSWLVRDNVVSTSPLVQHSDLCWNTSQVTSIRMFLHCYDSIISMMVLLLLLLRLLPCCFVVCRSWLFTGVVACGCLHRICRLRHHVHLLSFLPLDLRGDHLKSKPSWVSAYQVI